MILWYWDYQKLFSNTYKGKLIVFEGHDCSGKTTNILKFKEMLDELGINCIIFRVLDYDLSISDRLRFDKIAVLEELFLLESLFLKAMKEIIEPALSAGITVLCDRWVQSLIVYQGLRIKTKEEENLHQMLVYAILKLDIDFSFVFSLKDKNLYLKRIKNKKNKDKFELENKEFLIAVYNKYQEISDRLFLTDSEPFVDLRNEMTHIFSLGSRE